MIETVSDQQLASSFDEHDNHALPDDSCSVCDAFWEREEQLQRLDYERMVDPRFEK